MERTVVRIEDSSLLEAISRQFLQCRKEVLLLKLHLRGRKYDPDQPRVPGGEPDAGQWTNGENGNDRSDVREWRSAMASRRSVAFCDRQYERDIFQCKMVGLPGCYAQAMQRYGACLAGTQIPPFNY
jgi:hypothetical protein